MAGCLAGFPFLIESAKRYWLLGLELLEAAGAAESAWLVGLPRLWFWLSGPSETKMWPFSRRRLANIFAVAALPNGHQVQLFYDFLRTNKLLKGYAPTLPRISRVA